MVMQLGNFLVTKCIPEDLPGELIINDARVCSTTNATCSSLLLTVPDVRCRAQLTQIRQDVKLKFEPPNAFVANCLVVEA